MQSVAEISRLARDASTSYVDLGKDGPLVYRSATNNVFVFLRSFYQDPKNLACIGHKSLEICDRCRLW